MAASKDRLALKRNRDKTMSMNLNVLRRMDPKVTTIFASAKHVAAYNLNLHKLAWVRWLARA